MSGLTRAYLGLAVSLAAAIFALLAPAAGRAEAPTGIDISNWQRQIDWIRVATSGHSFVFAKATESTTFTDVFYTVNRDGARGVGLRVGAYHFAQPAGTSDASVVASAVAQANHFVDVAAPSAGDLHPVLDLERYNGLSPSRLTLWTSAWLNQVAARLGTQATIYVSPSFWKQRMADSPVFGLAGHRLWIAHWTKSALPTLPGGNWGSRGWTFWQWSNCTKVPGITGCVDGNRLNSPTLNGAALLPTYPSGTVSVVEAPVVVGSPQVGKILAAAAGTWSGARPLAFTYEWSRCSAAGVACVPILGATLPTYTPQAADVGRTLIVSLTSSKGAVKAASSPTGLVAASASPVGTAPTARILPLVQGTLEVGQPLAAGRGTWTGTPTSYAYQWRRCVPTTTQCEAIAGAAGSTYTLTPADLGQSISLVVSATGRGGTTAATALPTAPITPAPLPPVTTGTAAAQQGLAGAVTSLSGVAAVSWQPGSVPPGASVTVADSASRLALPGTVVAVSATAPSPLPYWIEVGYAAPPVGAIPAVLIGSGTWQPLGELATPVLPPDQDAGVYRDGSGGIRILSRSAGRFGLFQADAWGDPRLVPAARPVLTFVTPLRLERRADGRATIISRFTIDTQAQLTVSVTAPSGRRVLLNRSGTRIGWWVEGAPQRKSFTATQLRPGALPLRVGLPAGALRETGRYVVRIEAVDPYNRNRALSTAFSIG